MAERLPRTPDLAAHVLGRLDGPRAAAVERRLAASPCLRVEADELREIAQMLQGTVPSALPEGLEEWVFAAVAAAPQREEAETGAPPADELAPRRAARARRPGARPLQVAAAVAATAVVAFGLGTLTGDDGGPGSPSLPVELQANLSGGAGSAAGLAASVVVRKGGTGRIVTLESSTLPALPKGVYYELWFVGPGDRPGAPQRISAGTFHPDDAGASDVTFHAAVDPAKYPGVAVTREPGDGNPAPSGPDLVRSG